MIGGRCASGLAALAAAAAVAAGQSPRLPPVTRPSAGIAGAPALPATRPGPPPATTQALDPAVLRLLDRLAAAYGPARPLGFTGTLVGVFDVAGRRRTYTLRVRGDADGTGRYAHRAAGAGLLVNDGRDAYLFDEQRNAYARLPATTRRAAADALQPSVVSVLLDENPALLLLLTADPPGLLRAASRSPLRPATVPTTAAATGPAEAGLVIDRGGKTVTLYLDPATGVVRRSVIDYAPAFAARHTHGLRTARVELTYDPPAEGPPSSDAFRWHPPVTATEFSLDPELIRPDATTGPATMP